MSSEDLNASGVQVEFTSEFKRNLRQLAKKYRRIKTDIQPVLDSLAKGETPGDQVPHLGESWTIFKVRARNSDSGRGKSGGYRIVYWIRSDAPVVLITVYSKSEQGDVRPAEIRRAIVEFSQSGQDEGP